MLCFHSSSWRLIAVLCSKWGSFTCSHCQYGLALIDRAILRAGHRVICVDANGCVQLGYKDSVGMRVPSKIRPFDPVDGSSTSHQIVGFDRSTPIPLEPLIRCAD